MQSFWEKIIEPIFEREQPKVIVEIGALYGEHTVKMLRYCQRHNGFLIVIDPVPAFHELQWGEELGRHLSLLRDFSLNVLPRLGWMDAVMIDGDHNWYTVYHELKEVEKFAQRTGREFPLVFLHDTEWPYGRRDLYYHPDRIPPQFRHPYALKGMEYGRSELVDVGGFNAGSYHALHENGPRNGVLTAIEDFMKESPYSLSLHRVASNAGLGVLVPANSERDAFIDQVMRQSGM